MTKDDVTPADGDDEGPITPEVVRRGAAGRKRRVVPGTEPGGPAPDDGPAPVPGRPVRGPATGRTFRMGCILLIGVGVIEVFIGSTRVTDPDAARCTAARFDIEAANDDDEEFNDVDLPEGIDDADDLRCADAVNLAGDIRDEEDEAADGEFTAASTFRTQGIVLAGLGFAHALAAFFTMRTRHRTVRNVALVTAAAGIFLPILGIVSLAGMIFVVYALAFSADAKALFPVDRTRPSMFRPRPPAGS